MADNNDGNGADGAPMKHKRHHHHHRHHRHRRQERDEGRREGDLSEQQRQEAATASKTSMQEAAEAPLADESTNRTPGAPDTGGSSAKNAPTHEELSGSASAAANKQTLSDQFEARMRMKLEGEDHSEVAANDAEASRNPASDDQESDDITPEVRKPTAVDQYEQRVRMKLEKRHEDEHAPSAVHIHIRDEDEESRQIHRQDVVCAHVSINSQDPPPLPLKRSAWRSVANVFSKPKRRVDAESPSADHESCDPVLIPEATLVEPNSDARVKWWKRIAIASSIVAIVLVVAGVVAATSGNANTEEVSIEATGDPKLTPEDVREKNGYNFWIRPVDFGERSIFYGASCNAMATVCDTCALYEARRTTNEIIGECSYCEPCQGGFAADCTNIAGGIFTCPNANVVEPRPEGLDYEQWEQWFCPYKKGERKVCSGMSNCYPGTTLCTSCGVYELKVNSTEVVGKCNSCQPCAAGGLKADCTNLGHGHFNCYFPDDE